MEMGTLHMTMEIFGRDGIAPFYNGYNLILKNDYIRQALPNVPEHLYKGLDSNTVNLTGLTLGIIIFGFKNVFIFFLL